MAQRRILAFLIRIVPVYAGLLWLWHGAGLANAYHRALAGFLDFAYPPLDPAGVVHGVVVDGHDLMLRLLVGTHKTGLAINAEDITSDFAMLAALYLSSPVLPNWRRFAAFFAGAVAVIFLLHAFTVFAVSQSAFAGHPDLAPLVPRHGRGFLAGYNVFFEAMGMYLYALVLWLPYMLGFLGRPTGDAPPSHTP